MGFRREKGFRAILDAISRKTLVLKGGLAIAEALMQAGAAVAPSVMPAAVYKQ